jgi:AcrR family transcriptional regulator
MDASPSGIGRLWRLSEGVTAPARPSLSLEKILSAGIELADSGGLGAVSMGRVAERVGFTTMSLYRHVASKDELLLLMMNAALGAPEDPDAQVDSWRRGLERWAWELLEIVQRHFWALRVPMPRSMGPSQLAWLDYGLRALVHTPLSEAEKTDLILLLNGYVFWQARPSEENGQASPDPEPGPSYSAQLAEVVDRDQFPALHRALEAQIFDDGGDPDSDFAFGLQRILDGIGRLIEERDRE